MSKERMEEVDRWLLRLKETLSKKAKIKEIEELQQFIDVYEWLREQAFSVYGGETFVGYKEQMNRYREAIKEIEKARNEYYGYQLIGNAEGLQMALDIIDKALKGESE